MQTTITNNNGLNFGQQTITTTGTLAERAMLVSLNVSLWTARKLDKKATRKVAEDNGASEHVGRYNKKLLPQDAPSYAALVAVGSSARTTHYLNTLPWAQDGARILTSANFIEYSAKMRKHKEEFERALEEFLSHYPEYVQNAREALKGLWEPSDYPSERDLRRRFQFDTSVFPLPTADDFRVSIGDAHVARIREEIERHTQQAVKAAVSDAWQRLHAALEKMHERLNGPDNIFRDSLFGNLQELCEVLPRLNLEGDPRLEEMTERIKAKVLVVSPQTAREDKDRRAVLAAEVDTIAALVGDCFVSLEE